MDARFVAWSNLTTSCSPSSSIVMDATTGGAQKANGEDAKRVPSVRDTTWFRVSGVGFEVWGLGCGVWGLGLGAWGFGFGAWGLGFGVWGVGFGVWGLGFGVWGLESGAWGLGFRVCGVRC